VLAEPEPLQAAYSILLLQPSPPLLFMGEEWGATEPFPFFCDFQGDLAEAVRQGRKREFAEAYAKHGGADIPDPLAQSTRDAAVLDWDARLRTPHAERLALTQSLLAARKRYVVPLVPAMSGDNQVRFDNGLLNAAWPAGDKTLEIVANLSAVAQPCPAVNWNQYVWGGAPPDPVPPWSVYAGIGSP